MKVAVMLGSILFIGGAGIVAYQLAIETESAHGLSPEMVATGTGLMVIPVVMLLGWAVIKIVKEE